MLKFLFLSGLAVAGLYFAGVRPETLKGRIETVRSENASIDALGDNGSDWG